MERQGNKLLIPADDYKLGMKKRIKGLRWSAAENAWFIYLTDDIKLKLLKEYGPKIKPLLADVQAPSIRSDIASYPFKTPPRAHQLEALTKALGKEAFGYFLEQGLGKTKAVIDEVDILNNWRQYDIQNVLIICPKTVIEAWLEQLEEHGRLGHSIRYWDSDRRKFIWHQRGRGRRPTNGNRHPLEWTIVNIDALVWVTQHETGSRQRPIVHDDIMRLLLLPTYVAVDESTSIKNPTADRTERVWNYGEHALYKRILTGTPIAKDPLDLYGQLYFLDPQIIGGWSFTAFKGEYCILGGHRDREILGFRNLDQLHSIMDDCGFRATKDQCLDLPSKTFQIKRVTLGVKSRRAYSLAVEEALAECEDIEGDMKQMAFSNWAMARLMKLRQLAGGAVKDESEDKGYVVFGNEKITALLEVMDEVPLPVLVWCQFQHEVKLIQAALEKAGYRADNLYGKRKQGERRAALKALKSGELDALIIQNDTGYQGLTLITGSVSIYYSNSLSYEVRVQSEDRTHRDGQTADKVTYIDIIARNTYDVRVGQIVRNKELVATEILDPAAFKAMLRDRAGTG